MSKTRPYLRRHHEHRERWLVVNPARGTETSWRRFGAASEYLLGLSTGAESGLAVQVPLVPSTEQVRITELRQGLHRIVTYQGGQSLRKIAENVLEIDRRRACPVTVARTGGSA